MNSDTLNELSIKILSLAMKLCFVMVFNRYIFQMTIDWLRIVLICCLANKAV